MAELTEQQIARFRADGFLMVEDAVTAAELDGLRRQYADWLAEASRRGRSWGETADRKARFDLDPVHTAEAPPSGGSTTRSRSRAPTTRS